MFRDSPSGKCGEEVTTGTSALLLRVEIEDFLFREAEVLDAGRYMAWLSEFVAEEIEYRVPVQVTRDRRTSKSAPQMMHVDDDWNVLELRALRVETEYAWSEDPPSLMRHFVSNVRVDEGRGNDVVNVKSNLLLYRTRGDKPTFDLLSAEREDVLRRVDGRFRLTRRTVHLDQTVIQTHNLTMVF